MADEESARREMSVTTILAYLISIAIPLSASYVIVLLDLFGTGKRSTILTCLGWGAIGAFGLAYFANSLIIHLSFVGYERGETLTGPIVEELLKSAILFYFITRPRFHYAVDGAIYGFACGIGFAVAENILYVSTYPTQALAVAISRALSTSLMHATTSALVGISLGHLRRAANTQKVMWALIGFVPAMLTHIVFNNVAFAVDQGLVNGTVLLILGFAIGLGGAALIGVLISRALDQEKKRFAQTLGLDVGISSADRKATQQSGEKAIEAVLKELGEYFGADKITLIRKLLVTQANIGILRNNLNHPVSERLRKAWQDEISAKRAEIDQIRGELGLYVMSFLRGAFPDDAATRDQLQQRLADADPTQIHIFDMFIVASKIAQTVSPERLSQIADLLKQIDLFKDVSLPDLENLSRAISTRYYTDGEVIFNDGDPGDELFVINSGAIQILSVQLGANDREKLLNTCNPGDIVGELALLDGNPRSAMARAKGDLETLVLRRDQFMTFMQSRPNVILAMLRFLAQRARHASEIVDVSIKWASEVAQGNYNHSDQAAQPATANGPAAPPRSRISGTLRMVEHPESANVSEDAPILLRGVFSKVSESLKAREANPGSRPSTSNIPPVADSPDSKTGPSSGNSSLFSRIKI